MSIGKTTYFLKYLMDLDKYAHMSDILSYFKGSIKMCELRKILKCLDLRFMQTKKNETFMNFGSVKRITCRAHSR
jgi:hypothetical protein